MASKKGIAITAAIVAAIVGASSLVWLIPQSSPGMTSSEIISDVYARHNDLAANVESRLEQWQAGNVSSQDMLTQISAARADIQEMQKQIRDARPEAEWRQSFNLYTQALETFLEFLGAAETRVNSGDVSDSPEIEDLKKRWRDYVDQSVEAMPIAS